MTLFNIKISLPRWLLILAIIFFIIILIFISAYFIFELKFQNKIYPGIFISNLDLSGKTFEEAKKIINNQVDKINQNGIVFYYQDLRAVVSPVISSLESDLAYQIINFNVDQTIAQALAYGRKDDLLADLENKIYSLIFKNHLSLFITSNQQEIEKILKENFSKYEQPAKNAELIISRDNYSTDYQIALTSESFGKIIDYNEGINKLIKQLANLNSSPIKLSTITDYPSINKKDCLNVETQAKSLLDLSPIILKYNQEKWELGKDELANLLTLKKITDKAGPDKVVVGLDENNTGDLLNLKIASKINQEPIDAKFSMNEGRVNEFQASQDGIKLDIEATIGKIEQSLINKKNEIDIIVKIQKSNINTSSINNYGIKEVIGTGKSNFAGSPANRRHNIKVGADTLNGLLIKPGEEFSLIKALGKIDGSTGYLPELVIKENKTIPEFGGGLCQIGTTVFRTALASGLPITMRQNHSYRVVYYEPAGTDATIYNPWPDLKFINDTNNYLLIQSRIDGDNIYFDFWGTKDGRMVEQTNPTIYNIVKPGPAKIVETLDLKPGEKKCTEKAHNGADAYFDYKITYSSGEIKEKRFSSHYVPWKEVCLLGVEKLSIENSVATSTPTTADTTITP